MKNEIARMTIDMPTSVHKKFKELAARHGSSMREMVVEYINAKIENDKHECPHDHTPNAALRKRIEDTEKGKGLVRYKNIKEMRKKLGI